MSAKRDVGLYLEDILESIKRIEKYTKTVSKKALEQNIDIQDAVVRRLEIIGEAVKNIPPKLKTKYREVPWRKIAGTRDKIIHHYFETDIEMVWGIIKNDLQPLKRHIKKMLQEVDSGSKAGMTSFFL